MNLFEQQERLNLQQARPLAARMRPASLVEFVGQEHFLGPGKLLHRLLAADRLGSIIFSGPPGTGKTTLARLLADASSARFQQISAISSGVKEVRQLLGEAHDELAASGQQTLLFVDEIHRFSKSQQDALLHDVENGVVVLVGATTSNPFFAVNRALISRSQIFQFEPLAEEEIVQLLCRALSDAERGLGTYETSIGPGALEYLAQITDGDARRALNALEIAVLSASDRPIVITQPLLAESVQRRAIDHDATGDAHYDLASALIKSIRGSDPDAAIYWLARMLEAGEEVRFLTRRLVILASEDVGNADPQALTLAVACQQACEFVGLPECQLTLAQTVTYLACAEKSNASTVAIGRAVTDVREGAILAVPRHLRDAHYAGADQLGNGQGYDYSHNSPAGVAAQDYLGVERIYYEPVNRGHEAELLQRLKTIRARLATAKQAKSS